uniref:Uncharacterized protein n=1 Tax=Arundo donax TaxID=35708 RepID=A0A0A9GYL7_ARUDO
MGFAHGTLLLSPPAWSKSTCFFAMNLAAAASAQSSPEQPFASVRNSPVSSLEAWAARWRTSEATAWSVAAPEPMRAPSGSGTAMAAVEAGKRPRLRARASWRL